MKSRKRSYAYNFTDHFQNELIVDTTQPFSNGFEFNVTSAFSATREQLEEFSSRNDGNNIQLEFQRPVNEEEYQMLNVKCFNHQAVVGVNRLRVQKQPINLKSLPYNEQLDRLDQELKSRFSLGSTDQWDGVRSDSSNTYFTGVVTVDLQTRFDFQDLEWWIVYMKDNFNVTIEDYVLKSVLTSSQTKYHYHLILEIKFV